MKKKRGGEGGEGDVEGRQGGGGGGACHALDNCASRFLPVIRRGMGGGGGGQDGLCVCVL